MLPSVHHLNSDHTSTSATITTTTTTNNNNKNNSIGCTNPASPQLSLEYKPNQPPSMVSAAWNNPNNTFTFTPKLPSIHHLTGQVTTGTGGGISPRGNQCQLPQKLPILPPAQLATPVPQNQSKFEQTRVSLHSQPPYPITSSSHTQQHLHQLRSPVNMQYVFTQISPTSPISPVLSPHFVTQQQSEHTYSPPATSTSSVMSSPMPHTTNYQQFHFRQLSLPGTTQSGVPGRVFQPASLPINQQVNFKGTIDPAFEVKSAESAKVLKPFEKSKKKRRKRRGKSAPSTVASSSKSSQHKTISPIYTRKPRQTLVFNEDAIHYPVHKDLSSLINSNQIPPSVVDQLNTFVYPRIDTKKYSTSALDSQRNFLTVFEYTINDHWVIWDYETGFVHLTGIWKASLNADGAVLSTSSHSKADIVKLLESTPKQYQAYIKRIRGGFLKIQGTWLPFKLCKILARRFCYHIRFALIPVFGTDFPESCLHPSDPGYGELRLDELKNYEQGDLPAPSVDENASRQDQVDKMGGDKKEVEKCESVVSEQNHEPLRTPSTNTITTNANTTTTSGKQTTSLASPVRLNNDFVKVAKAEQLPPIGTFSPVSTKTKAVEDPKKNCTIETASIDWRYQSPSHSGTSNYKFGQREPLTSTSSDSLSSVFTRNPATQQTSGTNIESFNDLVDIVNASRCLQSLRQEQGNWKSSQPSTNTPSQSSVVWEEETDDESDYVTAHKKCSPKSVAEIDDGGISSILIAADLNKSFAYSSNLRSRISIKDLTT
ncbi:hypothetical protein KGF57_001899 [Candida theae]|uniref:HTH APSES-type domain-containing protein n=1 Tax=Candida theae TaxID=1198502 RepID=A0AAD5FZF8_9ASCO|nr:uncharacterized protein KGF57_001899 [Candida theae]KAI5960503.1 hypothetical protein KGF57_001899 [Candida theae]